MRFKKKQKLIATLIAAIMLFLLIQPIGLAWAMNTGDMSRFHGAAHSSDTIVPAQPHSNHDTMFDAHPASGDSHHTSGSGVTGDGDCCATAVCCPAVTNNGIRRVSAGGAVTDFEFRVSFQAIALPIEIKPPRHLS
jgi:hypothetical protein